MRKTRIVLIIAVLLGMLLVPVYDAGTVLAQDSAKDAACDGLGGCDDNGTSLEGVLTTMIQLMSVVAGIAAVIMIIISGFRFITANGDSGSIAAARRTLIYALVGVLVVAASQIIVQFVLGRASGG